MKIAVSFLACKKFQKAIQKIDYTDADYVHVDVIDNKFVKGRKISVRKIKKMDTLTSKRLDVHLMVKKPKKYIEKLAKLNVERIVFHVETEKDIEKNLDLIRSYGVKNGLAINPNTDTSILRPYMDKIDTILVMSVNPGYGGQEFIPETIGRVKTIRKMIDSSKNKILLNVDGGIKCEQISKLLDSDIIVSGSYVTNSDNYQEQINNLRNACIVEETVDRDEVLKEIKKEVEKKEKQDKKEKEIKKEEITSKSDKKTSKTTKKVEKDNDKKSTKEDKKKKVTKKKETNKDK